MRSYLRTDSQHFVALGLRTDGKFEWSAHPQPMKSVVGLHAVVQRQGIDNVAGSLPTIPEQLVGGDLLSAYRLPKRVGPRQIQRSLWAPVAVAEHLDGLYRLWPLHYGRACGTFEGDFACSD